MMKQKTTFDSIEIGDTIGRESYPYSLQIVEYKQQDVLITKLCGIYKNGKQLSGNINRSKFDYQGYKKMNIINGEVDAPIV